MVTRFCFAFKDLLNLLIAKKQSSRHHYSNCPAMTSNSLWFPTRDDPFDAAFATQTLTIPWNDRCQVSGQGVSLQRQHHSNGKTYDCIAFDPDADSDICDSTNITITDQFVKVMKPFILAAKGRIVPPCSSSWPWMQSTNVCIDSTQALFVTWTSSQA